MQHVYTDNSKEFESAVEKLDWKGIHDNSRPHSEGYGRLESARELLDALGEESQDAQATGPTALPPSLNFPQTSKSKIVLKTKRQFTKNRRKRTKRDVRRPTCARRPL